MRETVSTTLKGLAEHGVQVCRCVVLASPRSELPRALLRGLEQRGAVAIVATDAAAAMVDLAYSGAGALIVHEPEQQPRLGELLDAVHRYFPRTACWGYQAASDGPALARLNGNLSAGTSSSPAASPPSASPGHAPAPHQREEIGQRLDPLIVRVPHESSSGAEPLISDEELAMLLGPTPEDEPGSVASRDRAEEPRSRTPRVARSFRSAPGSGAR